MDAVSEQLKLYSFIQLVLINSVLIYLISLVRQDQSARVDYWRSMGFTPDTVYSVLSLRYPAVNGRVSIPGLPTIDWIQLFLVIIILVDVYYLFEHRARRSAKQVQTQVSPVPHP